MFYAHIIDLVEEWRPLVDQAKNEVVQHTLRVSSAISGHFMKEFPTLCHAGEF